MATVKSSFDAERLANSLGRIVPYSNWDQPIAEGYFPKLNNSNGGLNWASRPSGMVLRVSLFIHYSIKSTLSDST